jgi:thiol-disulfide isomerase/thioredoxin
MTTTLIRRGLLALAAAGTLGLAVAANTAASDRAWPSDWYFGAPAEAIEKVDSIVGKPAPSLATAADWKNGTISDADLEGQIVLLDIWATWCGPCIAAIPHNNKVMEKYADQGVKVVAITSSGNGQEKMEESIERHGIEYPIARDPGNQIAEAYQLQWYPHYVVIDREGIVRGSGLTPTGAENVIKALLEEQPMD